MLPAGRPATSWVHYTTSSNTQSSAPEDGLDRRTKHVELIGIINKPLLLHLVGVYIIYFTRKSQGIHFMFNNYFFRKSCRLWSNIEKFVQPDRPQATKWRMRIACWIPKATDTHLEYVTLTAFPLQRWLHYSTSMLQLNAHCVYFSLHLFTACHHSLMHLCYTVLRAVSMVVSTDGRAQWGNYSSHTRGTGCRLTCGLRGNEGFNTKHFLSLILMVLLLYEQEDSSWN